MSPIPSSAPKKPGILAWIGFVALAVIILIVVLSILGSFMSTESSSDTLIYRESGGMGMTDVVASRSEPSMAPAYLADNSIDSISAEVKRAGSAVPADDAATEQRIIRTGELSLRVTDATTAVEAAKNVAVGKGGYVESSSIADSGSGPRNAWMTLRIPVDTFDETLRDLKAVGTLTLNESIHGQDVTEEFVDLDADIRNAQAEEASYLEILKRTGEIKDVLAVTERLANVRGRIERLEGRKRYLENRTDLATISLSLTEETRVEVPGRTWKPVEVLKTALSDLIESLQGLVDFLIRLVIGLVGLLLPVALLTFLAIWLGWKIIRWVIGKFRR
ncbi:DUF4349 domain-containing protein [Patescibacteria group bacterium]|nr:DUF4349 domain-containing protein [Patescibacteria group bacterium]